MFRTMKMISGLSPAERATIESGQFAGEFTAEALLEQMRALANFDRFNDAARSSLKGRLGFCVVLAIVPLFFVGLMPWAFLTASALFALLAVYCAVMLVRLTKLDISNNFREVALPFLSILKQDMRPTQTLSVRLDLRPATHANKRRGTAKAYKQGVYTNIVDTNYRDAWFAGSAHLADASVLRWSVTDDLCESRRTKRSRSGKSKTKLRALKRTAIAVALSVASKRYGVDRMPGSAEGEKVAVHGEGKRRVIKLTRKLKTKSMQPMDPIELVNAVSGAYKRLSAPARSAA